MLQSMGSQRARHNLVTEQSAFSLAYIVDLALPHCHEIYIIFNCCTDFHDMNTLQFNK